MDVNHLGEQFDKQDYPHSSDALFIVPAYHLVEVELNHQRNAVGTSVTISHRIERMSMDEGRGPRSRILRSRVLIVVVQPKVEPEFVLRACGTPYPDGIWDEHNGLPIIRRGVTATHCAKDFRGRQEFLLDIVAIPGFERIPRRKPNTGAVFIKFVEQRA